MKKLMMVLIALSLTGCASMARNRYSDPVLRIAIDGDSIDSVQDHARLQNSLVESNFFVVVDRGSGFDAINKEQELVHQEKKERFGTNEKYARWGKMYGIGGILVATQSCSWQTSISNAVYKKCLQDLTLINATTGEVMASSEAISESEDAIPTASWNKTVDLLISHYPKKYIDRDHPNQTIEYSSALENYREKLSQEK